MSNGTLLHVEDDEALRGFVARALADAGYEIDGVESGVEALKRLRERPCDLVILDLVLPVMNGMEVIASLRASRATSGLPVLVTTGTFVTPNQFSGDHRLSVLRKPFDQRQLLAAIETLLYSAPTPP